MGQRKVQAHHLSEEKARKESIIVQTPRLRYCDITSYHISTISTMTYTQVLCDNTYYKLRSELYGLRGQKTKESLLAVKLETCISHGGKNRQLATHIATEIEPQRQATAIKATAKATVWRSQACIFHTSVIEAYRL